MFVWMSGRCTTSSFRVIAGTLCIDMEIGMEQVCIDMEEEVWNIPYVCVKKKSDREWCGRHV